jgi:CDP-paratose 2-epimerase
MSNIMPLPKRVRGRVLVTGGCGFIGCNLIDALLSRGNRVLALDSFARPGATENADWLKRRHGDALEIQSVDVRDAEAVTFAVKDATAVLHLAAQVAVTTSLDNPREDFGINAVGTLNVLEAVRCHNPAAPVLFASTNKVYGALGGIGEVVRRDRRYIPCNPGFAPGVSEQTPLDFYSPYGCSKGTADQYVHDYARVFGLRTAVLRMSCIYGPRQFGTEDQGWIAHFLRQAMQGKTVTLYGDGYQVRDALFIDDAVEAWLAVLDSIEHLSGRVFNLGGGPDNTTSLLEMMDRIAELRGSRPRVRHEPWRPGDQPWYVSDVRSLTEAVGWRPRMSLDDGLRRLDHWLESRFGETLAPKRAHEGRGANP